MPAPGDFTVTVAGSSCNVASGGVAISGRAVTLTLELEVAVGESVAVSYTPGTNRDEADPRRGGS